MSCRRAMLSIRVRKRSLSCLANILLKMTILKILKILFLGSPVLKQGGLWMEQLWIFARSCMSVPICYAVNQQDSIWIKQQPRWIPERVHNYFCLSIRYFHWLKYWLFSSASDSLLKKWYGNSCLEPILVTQGKKYKVSEINSISSVHRFKIWKVWRALPNFWKSADAKRLHQFFSWIVAKSICIFIQIWYR